MKWYQIYYLLACFDLLTVSGSLFLSHRIARQYNDAIAVNDAWVGRMRDFSELARLAADINAPGNDVFKTMEIDQERDRLQKSLTRFQASISRITTDFEKAKIAQTHPQLWKELQITISSIEKMSQSSATIMNLAEQNQMTKAGHLMATMDRHYYQANEALRSLRLRVSEIQQDLLARQAAQVGQIRILEQWISIALCLMIAAITIYGIKLAQQAQKYNRERDQYTNKLEMAHQQLLNTQQQLVESEHKFRAIFDHTFQFIGLLSPDGLLLEANNTALEFAGVRREDVIGKPFWETIWWSHSPELQMRLRDAITESSMGNFVRFEASHCDKHGHQVPVDFSLKPVFNKEKTVVMLIPEGRDIREKKEAEQRVSEFYSTVSHELRTPLTSIHGALNLIRGGLAGDVSEKALKLVDVGITESERLIRLINDILDLRKIEAGMLALKKAEVRASDLIEKTILAMDHVAKEAGLHLISEVKANNLIECDQDRIIQVLTNLVSNAIKFSKGTSDEIKIVLQSGENGFLKFSVIDGGRGIPSSSVHKLFGKFQQLDQSDSRKIGGTGLGLAISKALVEQHGGRIGAKSTTGQGSEFWFEIPA